MNGWLVKYWQFARCYFMRWHQPLHFYYSWLETLWAGPRDEHGKVGSPWSCDEHHTIMILREHTLKEVLVYILAVYMQFFIERRLSDYLCKCCIVWSRDTHTSHCHIRRYIVQKVLVRIWWFQWWSLLRSCCMFFVMNTIPPTSERLSLTGDGWHGGSHPRVFLWRSVKNSYILVWSSVMKTDHTTRISGGHLHTSLVVKRCQRRSLRYLHSVVLWYTPLAFTLERRFLRILFTWWHFVQLSCGSSWAVVRLVVALCGLVENVIPPWCVRGALSEAWKHMMVVLPFRCLRRGPSDDQCYICIEWLCGTHESPWCLQEVCT